MLDKNLDIKAEAKDLNFYYGNFHALKGLNMPVYDKKVSRPESASSTRSRC